MIGVVEIRIPDSAFAPGGPLEGFPPHKCVIPFGTGKLYADFVGEQKMTTVFDRPLGSFELAATVNGQSIPTALWNLMYDKNPSNFITSVADAVGRGLVEVTKDDVVKTQTEILTNT